MAFALILTGPLSLASADGFDPDTHAPYRQDSQELRESARDYFASVADAHLSFSSDLSDRVRRTKWVDFRWQVARSIDAKERLDNLAEYGLIPQDDHSYEVNVKSFPQWYPLERRMATVFSEGAIERTFNSLRQRGFRDDDIDDLVAYLDGNFIDLRIAEETESLNRDFGNRTIERARQGIRLDHAEAENFSYQVTRKVDDIYRTWAVELVDSLDRQAQRVLESYLNEVNISMVIYPSDTAGTSEKLQEYFVSGKYLQDLEQQKRRASLAPRVSEEKK